MSKHDPGHNGHLTLPDGRALDVRPMWIIEKTAIAELDERLDEESPMAELIAGLIAIIEPAVSWKSWDGSLDQMTETSLLRIASQWRQVTEDDAFPPENGTDSETK